MESLIITSQIRLWSSGRTQSEIQSLMSTVLAGDATSTYPSLTALYSLLEGPM